jgi:membrane protease YdiL (CAAX protease family)
MLETTPTETPDLKQEAVPALVYFAIYMAYLFYKFENEFMHWITLVIVPLLLLFLLQRMTRGVSSLRLTLASVGFKKGNLATGLGWAVILGLLFSVAQLYFSRQREAIIPIMQSGKVAYLFPLTFLLMFGLAGFTEEFFFRGVLQTRLARWLNSNWWAVLVTALLFGFYHLPYAYFNPRWPSHGDWSEAISSAFSQGGIGGLILGTVYVKAKNNLVACIVVHALINTLPGMVMIKFGSQ